MGFVNEVDLGITLPESIVLQGSIKGNSTELSTNTTLTSTQGIAKLKGNFKNKNTIAYETSISVEDYKINELLNNPQFGALSLNLKSSGNGKTINTLDASLDATVSKFQLNDYAIKDLNLAGNIKNGTGKVISKYKDDNLNIKLDAFVVLD